MDEAARLIDKLKPGSPELRRAVEALTALGALAVGPLIVALENGPWQVRQQAAKALGKIGDRRAVEPLIAALGHGRLRVRREAARALGRIADPRAVPPLIAALRDRTGDVRREGAAALVKIGAPAVPALIAALSDRATRRARPLTIGALGEIALRDPAPGLRAALPILADLTRSFWSGKELKNACRTAIERIDEATASRKDLPVPAGQPPPSAADLPLPAEAPMDDAPVPAPRRWWERLLGMLGR